MKKPAYYYHACPICHTMFVPKNNRQKYCCQKHTKQASRQKLAREREFYRACDLIDSLIKDCSRTPDEKICLDLQKFIAKISDRVDHALDVHPESAKYKKQVRVA